MASPDAPPHIDWHSILKDIGPENPKASIQAVSQLAEIFRTSPRKLLVANFESLCDYTEQHQELASYLCANVHNLVASSNLTLLLTESGITGHNGFATELLRRIERRFVPEPDDPEEFRAIIHTVFSKDQDYRWVEQIPSPLWMRFFSALCIGSGPEPRINKTWATSLRILSHHISSLGLQPEITHRLPHLDEPDSPFLALSDEVLRYIKGFQQENYQEKCKITLQKALSITAICRKEVEQLRKEKGIYGTSLRLTGLTFRLLQQLNRLETLLRMTVATGDEYRQLLEGLFKELVKAENTRNHIRPHIKDYGDLLVFQIVEHAAKKGSKYITSGRKDYWNFFLASLGGGFIVGVFACIKLLLKQLNPPLAVEAVIYGVNYSICFILIYLTGTALATKQPAMTANTLAQSLERNKRRWRLEGLENLIVRVWRSQFISFAGNLLMAMPVAFTISIIYHVAMDTTIVTQEASEKLMVGTHPWRSGMLIYAAFAGFFLFMSALIAGWVDNRNLYSQFPKRIASHPLLIRVFGPNGAKKVSTFWDKKLGIVTGNIVLGFCLGSTATVGEIIGLPIDIRHIAFSSAQFGVAMEVSGTTFPQALIIQAAIGVILIGFINFLVSFGLSLTVALKSRRVRFSETRRLLFRLGRRFLKRPLDWFFPPREAKSPIH